MTPPNSRTLYSLLCEMADRAPDHPVAMTATEVVTFVTASRTLVTGAEAYQIQGLREQASGKRWLRALPV